MSFLSDDSWISTYILTNQFGLTHSPTLLSANGNAYETATSERLHFTHDNGYIQKENAKKAVSFYEAAMKSI